MMCAQNYFLRVVYRYILLDVSRESFNYISQHRYEELFEWTSPIDRSIDILVLLDHFWPSIDHDERFHLIEMASARKGEQCSSIYLWNWKLGPSPKLKRLPPKKKIVLWRSLFSFPFVITPPPFLAFQMTFSEHPLHSCYSFFSCLIMFQDERHIQKYLKHVYS